MFSKQSLELLDTVARFGSFTLAASHLHKVPSAISYAVRQIEQQLGVSLFERLPRRVELTPAGEVFIQQARHLLREMEQIEAQTKRAAVGWHQTLRLTIDNVVKIEQLKPLIEAFYQTFDYAELQINMEVFNGCWDAIADGRADIVLGATSAIPVNGDFAVKNMGELEWAFVMSPDHPLAQESHLDEQTVSAFPAICLDDTSINLPKRHNWHYAGQRRLLLPNWSSATNCLRDGIGVGYMPRHIAKKYLNKGQLVERALVDNKPLSSCVMVWRDQENHRLLEWLVDYLGDEEKLYRDWLQA
ncbi:DNA-binding transcriptional activator PunR [Vibrio sp. SCSIO 43136]|uniref:DNA-binding transcriptional activator PunR n=1 Tax=Vibrio sp. SCSIO 43136 TaxID=2819101 RepID=UPI002074F4A0|nr:DNA-binding transcriptional activator PunR [Vibrio sp. SCSIO 43136]USD65309.1 LysR family transcriptional regulator [Vibrio sp. SCSIO 43136]